MFDPSIFASTDTWLTFITLLFLEIILGVDNLVFISITSDRLPKKQQHRGRQLGLAGALVMRIVFLCFASFLVHLVNPLFTVDLGFWSHGVSIRDLILLLGGLYLIYKGSIELRDMLTLKELKMEYENPKQKEQGHITLLQAVVTIMLMDIVFSIDSVITAVGLTNHLIIMILAVIAAVIIMIVFIDQISDFINNNAEMKILALTFIALIGLLLVLDSMNIHSGIELLDMHLEKLMVYFAMLFSAIMEFVQIAYKSKFVAWKKDHPE